MMSEMAELAEETTNDSVRLGAVKTRMAIRHRVFELKQIFGLMPWGQDHLKQRERMDLTLAGLISILQRHDVPREVIDDLKSLGEADRESAARRLEHPWLTQLQDDPKLRKAKDSDVE
jgi:hypothetical protein